jgi:hypothetical protein
MYLFHAAEFEQLYLSLRIAGFLDFTYRSEFYITKKHNVSGTGSVSFLR